MLFMCKLFDIAVRPFGKSETVSLHQRDVFCAKKTRRYSPSKAFFSTFKLVLSQQAPHVFFPLFFRFGIPFFPFCWVIFIGDMEVFFL